MRLRHLSSYETLARFVLIFLLAYPAISLYTRSHSTEEKSYPFFAWFVFDRVPHRTQRLFEVRVLEYGGEHLDPPRRLLDFPDLNWGTVLNPPEINRKVQVAGALLGGKGSDNQIQTLARELDLLFAPRSAAYEIVEVSFNTVEHWKSGSVLEIKSIARFRTHD